VHHRVVVNRKKPRNNALGPTIIPRVVGEPLPPGLVRDSTYAVGPMTTRNLDGTPRDTQPPAKLVPLRGNTCDRCGARATSAQYVDRVLVKGAEQFRHVVCSESSALSEPVPTVQDVTAEPPYRRCEPPVPVLVHVPGESTPFPGFVEGWRGQRVKVTWNSGVGMKHSGWLPAKAVERVAPHQ
jgi:hypothetical protein